MPASRHQRARFGIAVGALCITLGIATVSSTAAPQPSQKAATNGKLTKKERKKRRVEQLREANKKQKRPNILVVMTDDQDASMEGLNRVTRLIGSKGTTFTNSYVSFPLCCPARATFLTGQYAHNHGVTSTELPNGYGAFNKTNHLAIWLRRAGYRTGMVGKYLNGYGIDDGIPERVSDAKEVPSGWREWYALTADKDQRRYHYRLNENGKIIKYKGARKDYVTDVLGGKAVDFVRRNAPRPKPFFLWFNPTAPHGEAGGSFRATRNPTPARRHFGLYEGSFRPRTPNFNEKDVSDKPAVVRTTPELGTAEILDIDQRYRGRVESLLSVDQVVKRLFTRLRKARDLRKTYVIFTSDNGLMMGAHRLLLKNYLYEEDTRVPLMIRGPRFPKGAVRDQFVSNVDLAPTIVELTKVKPGLTMDGRSLLGPANDTDVGVGREVLFEVTGDDAGIRSGQWIYIDRGPGDTSELYNMVADPFQLDNLLAVIGHPTPAEQTVADQLKARLTQLRGCAGASCP